MSTNETVFIGYTTIEGLIEALRSELPTPTGAVRHTVQSLGVTEPENGSHGLHYNRYVHLVSFVRDRCVHYCRINWGVTEHIADTDFGSHNEEIRQRAIAGTQLVDAWLRQQGLVVQQAVVATPRNMRLLDGWANFLHWDKDAKQFITPPAPQAADTSA